MANNTNERRSWAGRINNVHPDFVDFLESSMRSAAMQVEIMDILITVLNEHKLLSAILHKEGTNSYRLSIKHSHKRWRTGIEKIRVNFNRFNMSLKLVDGSEDLNFGIFRFRTVPNKEVKCTLTSPLHYSSHDDVVLVDELKEVFHEAEMLYRSGDKRFEELNEPVDLDNTTMNDLCQKYTCDCTLKGKINRAGYGDMSANEFYKTVDFKKLKRKAGIGLKSICVLKDMAIYYGVEGFETNGDNKVSEDEKTENN